MEELIVQLALALGPAIIVGSIAYYFFNGFVKNEDGRRRFLLQKDSQADSLPVKLQAYERLALFLERIKPSQLLIRIKPNDENKSNYEQQLINAIEQEFEHNLAQQIYMSDELWNIIKSAKNGSVQLIRQTGMSDKVATAADLREKVLRDGMDMTAPSLVALEYLKKEIREVIG